MRKQNASRHVSRANRVSNASLKIYHRCFLVFQLNRARASNNSLKLSLSLSETRWNQTNFQRSISLSQVAQFESESKNLQECYSRWHTFIIKNFNSHNEWSIERTIPLIATKIPPIPLHFRALFFAEERRRKEEGRKKREIEDLKRGEGNVLSDVLTSAYAGRRRLKTPSCNAMTLIFTRAPIQFNLAPASTWCFAASEFSEIDRQPFSPWTSISRRVVWEEKRKERRREKSKLWIEGILILGSNWGGWKEGDYIICCWRNWIDAKIEEIIIELKVLDFEELKKMEE